MEKSPRYLEVMVWSSSNSLLLLFSSSSLAAPGLLPYCVCVHQRVLFGIKYEDTKIMTASYPDCVSLELLPYVGKPSHLPWRSRAPTKAISRSSKLILWESTFIAHDVSNRVWIGKYLAKSKASDESILIKVSCHQIHSLEWFLRPL